MEKDNVQEAAPEEFFEDWEEFLDTEAFLETAQETISWINKMYIKISLDKLDDEIEDEFEYWMNSVIEGIFHIYDIEARFIVRYNEKGVVIAFPAIFNKQQVFIVIDKEGHYMITEKDCRYSDLEKHYKQVFDNVKPLFSIFAR